MVSFKTTNCLGDHAAASCHLPGSLRAPLNNCNNNYPLSQGHNHEPPLRHTPSRTGYTIASHGCALHARLDQPVTTSTPGMDDKKVVQTAPTSGTGQPLRPKSSLDTSGVVASISGVRRRSGPQGLRSPAAKRPLSAPVALQGWLHKQGSEGLMLWKKRWFVLSEYCLFYYKGPEEEKLLGSILLPSYRVTACKPEDKVNKKFAFKAEHANMRTYHFAADTRESMNQWVNALTLASLLQDPNPSNAGEQVPVELAGPADGDRSARPSVSSISSILNQSADDSDSGFHGFQSRDDPSQSNNNSSPNSINTASFPNLSASNSNHGNVNNNSPEKGFEECQPQPMVNGWMQPPPQFSQPSTSQHYGHIQSPGHPQHPQHQALMHQYMTRQQIQPGPSNVQTVQPMPRNFGQPVYANAPPKPRRLTDGSTDYSTPSPDPDFRKSPVQPGMRMTAKSPILEYDRGNAIYASRLAQQQNTPTLRTDKSGLNYGYGQTQPAERRTPDTYGRSAQPRVARGNGDYEDVYAGPQLYQRPAGPVGYTKGPAPVPISIPVYAVQGQTCPNSITVNGPVMRQQKVQPPPRPHSADFLEYEATRRPTSQTADQSGVQNQQRRPQRPKSSLDVVPSSEITSPNGDGYFYSEERYAAQMRQSAVYLHQTPQQHQQQRNQSLSRATTPSKSSPRVEEPNGPIGMNEMPCATRRPQRELVYRQHPMTTQSLQRYTDASTNEAMMRRSLRERSYEPSYRDTVLHGDSGTVPRRVARNYESQQTTPSNRIVDVTYGSHSYHGEHGPRRYSDQQFARSASARLPRTRHPTLDNTDDDDYSDRTTGQGSRDGERRIQQREESMKRLLEWKQRMLQSPLTRKTTGATNGVTTAQSELSNYYKRQVLLDLAAHEASVAEARHSRRRDDNSHRPHTRSKSSDGRRSVVNVSRYNSYSSDDEELDDVRRKRTRRPSHAGRSPRHSDETNGALQGQPTVTFSSAIPPDAGYEEVSFPPQEPPAPKNIATAENFVVKNSKKPGILKTPSSYPNRSSTKPDGGRLSALAGEAWQKTKNVQWDSNEDKENWDSRIDESKVIKEFSYEYIKPEVGDIENDNWEGNLVQSRIKSFECTIEDGSPIKEMLSMQEPLKVSPPQATEAHVSRLDSARVPPIIRKFALADARSKTLENPPEETVEQRNDGGKSVKDLLADFERKSQQVRNQENNKRDEIKHRGVFSDTETLLYDTGSDLDLPDKSEEEVESDKALEYKEVHTSTIKRNHLDKKIEERIDEIKTNLNDNQVAIEGLGEGADAFARLSMTESMVTHGDNLSGESDSSTPKIDDINPEEHYLPMSPRKAILDPNNDDRPDPKMMESLFANLRHEESSYVEMTQNGRGRSLLAPSGDTKLDSGDYSTLEASHYEFVCVADNKVEPVYMEVSQLAEQDQHNSQIPKKKESTNGQIRSDLPDILTALKSDSSDADDESSKDLDSIDAPRHPRFSLSDTFRPASYYLSTSRTIIAEMQDSSDSELVSPPPIPTSPPPLDDLESLEMQDTLESKKSSPQVPVNRDSRSQNNLETHRPPSRFSDGTISSTFRDSRISLESASGSDTLDPRNLDEEERHRRMKRRPVSDGVCEVLDSLEELESLGSRFDGTSIDLDQYLEELQARDAFNVDLYSKDLSYNSIYGFNENMLMADKVHKTSQEISKINLNSSTLDQPFTYQSRTKTSSVSSLPSMRVSDTPPSHQHSQSFTGDAHYENVSFSPLPGSPAIRQEQQQNRENRENREDTRSKSRSQLSHNRDPSYPITSNAVSMASTISTTTLSPMVYGQRNQSPYHDQRPKHHSRSASQDSTRYTLTPNHRSSSSQDSNNPVSSSGVKTPSQSLLSRSSPAVHPVNNPNSGQADQDNDQTGAPYYYSDLQAGVSSIDTQSRSIQTFIAHTSRLPQLNNQRGDSTALSKRNDIGRLVNPIVRQIPRRAEVDDIDEARRIAAELRKNSSQFLVDNKSGLVDKRNFYEADTLRRVKSTDPLPDVPLPDVSNVNLYPQGLRDKSGSQTQLTAGDTQESVHFPQPNHRRSRSLEGLLDDVELQNLVEQRNWENRENRVSSVPPTRMMEQHDESFTFARINSEEPFQGEDTWEQDTLWRESLRRVSLRHARSLDNLDTPASRPDGSGSETPDTRGRAKITRGATYVNDSISLQRLSSPENSQERSRVLKRGDTEDNGNEEDDGAYEALTMDRTTGGYIWDPENEAYKLESVNTNHFLEEGNLRPVPQPHRRSFELDREKLRQWDLLSSACLLQEQQRTSMAESGRGLPVSGRCDEEMSIMMRMIMEEERKQGQVVAECVGSVEGIRERIRIDGEKDNGRGEWLFGTGAGYRG